MEHKLSIFKSSTATLKKSCITCTILIKVTRKNNMQCVQTETSRWCFVGSILLPLHHWRKVHYKIYYTGSIQLLLELPTHVLFQCRPQLWSSSALKTVFKPQLTPSTQCGPTEENIVLFRHLMKQKMETFNNEKQ